MSAADDVIAIQQLMARFATGIDTCDPTLYRSVFTDEIDLDYSSWRSSSIGTWSADAWVERAGRLFPGLTTTRHALSNLLIDVEGDTARVRAAVRADHVLVGPDGSSEVFTLDGYYDDRVVRGGDGWKICGKRLVVEWTTGDRSLLERAARRVADGRPLRHWSPSDPGR